MSSLEEQIRVYVLALEELKLQLLKSDSLLLRAEYNVIVGKINKMSKEYEQEKMGKSENSNKMQ